MDLLVCPECEQRYAVRGGGGGGGDGWLCMDCPAELRFVERTEPPESLKSGLAMDWHLHYLHPAPVEPSFDHLQARRDSSENE